MPPDADKATIDAATAHLAAITDAINAINDPVTRERTARQVTDRLLPALTQDLKKTRQAIVLGYREQGLIFREIAERLGDITTARVDQIAKGK